MKPIIVNNRSYGFIVNGKAYLERCPECQAENYAACVSSGQCAWCGYKYEIPKRKED